ncbi:MAG: ABC transporter permease [Firmicutes bacterium]|nr:ABC transporter permease [Bacillota bacterium]
MSREAAAAARVVYAIAYREVIRFLKDRSRWLGFIAQPLLYLTLIGYGIAHSMTFRSVPAAAHVNYLSFMYPGILGMSVLFTAIFSGVGIIWDREFGFLREVLVAPVPRWAVAVGKALGIAAIVVVQSAVLLALAPVAGIPLGVGMAAGVLGVAAVMGFGLGSLGIAIAARMQSMEGFQFVMNVLTMPMFFLSGAMYPLRGLPVWLTVLTRVDPLAYGVDALRNVVYGAGQEVRLLVEYPVGLDLGVMAALAAVLAVLGAWAFEGQET